MLFPGNVYGLVSPVPPVNDTDKLLVVVFVIVQNAPRSVDVKEGTVTALNPPFVIRYSVEMELDDSVTDVPVIFDVINRYSVGAVRRMFEVAVS